MPNKNLADKVKNSYHKKKYISQMFIQPIKTYNPVQYNDNKRKMKRG